MLSAHTLAVTAILAADLLGSALLLYLASRPERGQQPPEREDADTRPLDLRLAA